MSFECLSEIQLSVPIRSVITSWYFQFSLYWFHSAGVIICIIKLLDVLFNRCTYCFGSLVNLNIGVNNSQIPINSIIFINDKLDHYLLIKYQDKYDLIIVSPTKSDLSKVKKITTKIDKIYLYQNQIVDISYNKKYLLNKNQIIDNIEYKNQILTISINNQKILSL